MSEFATSIDWTSWQPKKTFHSNISSSSSTWDFDLTIHTLLPDRPATSRLANMPLDWFKSNLTENTYVQFTPLCSGVLQGSVLGPLPLLLTSLLPLGKIFHSFDRPGALLCRWHQALPVHMHSFLFLMYGVKCKMQSSSSLSKWAAAIRLNQAGGVRLQCYVKVRKQWRVQSEKSLQEINSAKLCVCVCVCVSSRACVCVFVRRVCQRTPEFFGRVKY